MLAVLKFSTLDPYGMGVEMEGGKPGWNDAMNGLPGILGSSMAGLCVRWSLLFDDIHTHLMTHTFWWYTTISISYPYRCLAFDLTSLPYFICIPPPSSTLLLPLTLPPTPSLLFSPIPSIRNLRNVACRSIHQICRITLHSSHRNSRRIRYVIIYPHHRFSHLRCIVQRKHGRFYVLGCFEYCSWIVSSQYQYDFQVIVMDNFGCYTMLYVVMWCDVMLYVVMWCDVCLSLYSYLVYGSFT